MKEKASDIRQDLHMGNNDESREEIKKKRNKNERIDID